MTLHVVTAGTSIMGGRFDPARHADMPAQVAAKLARDAARAGDDPFAFLVLASAETHGLVRAGCAPGDKVVILASDTDEGRLSAEAVARLAERDLGAAAHVRKVEGLQVLDGVAFRRQGIRNLLDIALREGRQARAEHRPVLFHATGGFKSVVPYLTLLGQFERIEVVYVYENSDTLIRLPALPVRFDHDRVAPLLPALEVLGQREVMGETAFRALVPPEGHEDPEMLDRLIEKADGYVSLSGAGMLALGAIAKALVPRRVMLHPRARRGDGFDSAQAQVALREMAVPQRRRREREQAQGQGTDLVIWKTKGGSAPRLFYWERPGAIFVAEVIRHTTYENDFLTGRWSPQRADYDVDDFEDHVPDGQGPVNTVGTALDRWLEMVDTDRERLEQTVATLEQSLADLRERVEKESTGRQRAEREAVAAVRERYDALARAARAEALLVSPATPADAAPPSDSTPPPAHDAGDGSDELHPLKGDAPW